MSYPTMNPLYEAHSRATEEPPEADVFHASLVFGAAQKIQDYRIKYEKLLTEYEKQANELEMWKEIAEHRLRKISNLSEESRFSLWNPSGDHPDEWRKMKIDYVTGIVTDVTEDK